MKITRFTPPPPPAEFSMTFTQDEGWALTMALNDAYYKYHQANDREQWRQWAKDLTKELRS